MARLYDRLMAEGYSAIPGDEVPFRRDSCDDALAQCMKIVADNVTEFYFAGTEQEEWDVDEDFPCLAPPFPVMWIETRAPSRIVSEINGVSRWPKTHPSEWGLLFVADENTDRRSDPRWRWRVNALVFLRARRRNFGPVAIHCHFSDDLGRAVRFGGKSATGLAVSNARARDPGAQELTNVIQGAVVNPCLLALSFMHCKNVEGREVEQQPKLSKKWEKKHGRPLVRYHVLDIDPMRKTLESEGGVSTSGLKKALHICRGHFATYTEDAPLFGKVTGTFWKPQHVRGRAKQGVVVKDYNVKAPR